MAKLEKNFNIDIALTFLFLIIMEPKLTGLVLHEWIGLSVGIIFIVHIIMHWQWIVEATKRYFKKFPKKSKLNYALDILLLICSGGILLSALPISKKIGFAWLGIGGDINMWQHLHVAFSFLTLLVIAIHLGLHWKWVINAIKKIGQFDIGNMSKPIKGVFIIMVLIVGLYSLTYVDYFTTVKNNLVFDGQYISQPQNKISIDNNNSKSSSIILSSDNTNIKGKGGRGGAGGGRGSGSGYPSFTVTTDSTSILAYFGIAILIIMIVYYLEILVNKFKRRKRILLN